MRVTRRRSADAGRGTHGGRPNRWTVLLLVFTVLSFASWGQAYLKAERGEERVDALEYQTTFQGEQSRDLIDQVRSLGEKPVVTNAEVPVEAPPADADVSEVVEGQVRAEVDAYFDRFPAAATVREAVADLIAEDPPRDGRTPTDREIAATTADYLDANPPPPGADGSDGQDGADGGQGIPGVPGRGVTSVRLEGCALVFTLSDGSTQTVGPVCGERGEVGPQGPPGVVSVRSEPTCQGGEGFLTSARLDLTDQTITQACTRGTVPGPLDPVVP